MVCARVRAIMHSLTLVHYRYVHVHNHGISKTYKLFQPNSFLCIDLQNLQHTFLSNNLADLVKKVCIVIILQTFSQNV